MSYWLYQGHTEPVTTPAPPDVSVYGWRNEWLPPVRRKFATALIAVVTTISPHALTQPEASSVDKWFQPLSQRLYAKQQLPTSQQSVLAWSNFTPAPIENITEDKWHYAWSEPVRFRRFATNNHPTLAWSSFTPEPSFGWFEALADPPRRKPSVAFQQFSTGDTEVIPESVLAPWFAPWTDPVLQKVGLRVQYQSSVAWSTFTPAGETVTVDKWFIPLSERLYARTFRTELQATQAFVFDPLIRGWIPPWSEPVRFNRYPVHQQSFIAQDLRPVVSFGWYGGLSEPVRVRAALASSLQQVAASDTRPVVSFSWFGNLSDPVRFRAFSSAEQSTSAWGVFTPAPPITDIGWYGALSEPVRVLRYAAAQQSYLAQDLRPIVSFGWLYGLSEPVRYRVFNTSLQRSVTEDTTIITDPRSINWYAPWHEPVRIKVGLQTSQQVSSIISLNPIVSFGWFGALTEPVRLKKGIAVQYQPDTTTPYRPLVSFGWYGLLSEPVRQRPRLLEASQPVWTGPITPTVSFGWYGSLSDPARRKPWPWAANQNVFAFYPQPIIVVGTIGWFGNLSEPVRVKPGLLTSLQKTLAAPERVLANPVFVTLAATEDNRDVFSAGVDVSDAADTAIVSIEEIPYQNDAVLSIREP